MIRIFLGNLGSGKTISAVREMVINQDSGRTTYTNIVTKNIKNVIRIQPQDIITKSGDKKPSYDLNVDFWNTRDKPLNILWDEVHLTANSRMSMSKVNMILSRFIAMARRITGFDDRGYGHFTFIAQKDRTIDVNIRDLCNEIIYHIGRWILHCQDCGTKLWVNSEMQQLDKCIRCKSWNIRKENLMIEQLKFSEWNDFYAWTNKIKGKWWYEHTIVTDIDRFFDRYDTMQMENIWENYIK